MLGRRVGSPRKSDQCSATRPTGRQRGTGLSPRRAGACPGSAGSVDRRLRAQPARPRLCAAVPESTTAVIPTAQPATVNQTRGQYETNLRVAISRLAAHETVRGSQPQPYRNVDNHAGRRRPARSPTPMPGRSSSTWPCWCSFSNAGSSSPSPLARCPVMWTASSRCDRLSSSASPFSTLDNTVTPSRRPPS